MDTAHQISQDCLLMRSRRLSRVVTRVYLDHMQEVGLSVAQFTLLTAIGTHPGVRAADLAAGLDLEKSTVSRELGTLTEHGYLRVEQLGGRSQGLSLSELGASRLAAAVPAWERAQAAVRAELGPLGDALLSYFPGR